LGKIFKNKHPVDDELPNTFIAIIIDKTINTSGYELVDVGLSLENMIIHALENGIGKCILVSYCKTKIETSLLLPDNYKACMLLVLGVPNEYPHVDTWANSNKCFKDENNILHVPKRTINDVLLKIILS